MEQGWGADFSSLCTRCLVLCLVLQGTQECLLSEFMNSKGFGLSSHISTEKQESLCGVVQVNVNWNSEQYKTVLNSLNL
jgi:hypothetical protein